MQCQQQCRDAGAGADLELNNLTSVLTAGRPIDESEREKSYDASARIITGSSGS